MSAPSPADPRPVPDTARPHRRRRAGPAAARRPLAWLVWGLWIWTLVTMVLLLGRLPAILHP